MSEVTAAFMRCLQAFVCCVAGDTAEAASGEADKEDEGTIYTHSLGGCSLWELCILRSG